MSEIWSKAHTGDELNPDATIRTGKRSTAVILLPLSNQRIALPAEVMLDISDMRELTQEELMLKLTMEKVRASSYEWKNKELNLPSTTMVHGESKGKKNGASDGNAEPGILQLNGTRVLYDNGFYPTCALKTMEVLRRDPSLNAKFEHRLLIAQALEKSNLQSEALNEYVVLSRMDIDLLAYHFLTQYAEKTGKRVFGIAREALRCLESYRWPGNVRELENTIERAVALETTDQIQPERLPEAVVLNQTPPSAGDIFALPHQAFDLQAFMADAERSLICQALKRSDGNQTLAAQHLGLTKPSLRHRIQALGIDAGSFRRP